MTTANERAIGMLKTALEMEEKGFKFYEQAVAKTQNELGHNIFQMLKEDEMVHVDRIKKIFAGLTGGEGWTDQWKAVVAPQRDLGEIFRVMAVEHGAGIRAETGDLDALAVGIDFEAKSVAFYREHLEGATDELEREFTAAMVAEEENHHELLADMNLYLTDPDAWFRENERGGLDGA